MNKLKFLIVLTCLITLTTSIVQADDALRAQLASALQQNQYSIQHDPIYGDFNLDGRTDLATLVGPTKLKTHLWVATTDAEGKFQILLDWPKEIPSATDTAELYKTQIYNPEAQKATDAFTYLWLKEEAQGTSFDSITFAFFQNQIRPVILENQVSHQITGSHDYIYRNLFNSSARRSYSRYESGTGKTISTSQTNFHYFIPAKGQVTVDGQIDPVWETAPEIILGREKSLVTYGASRWTGRPDLSYTVRTLLDGTNLFILVQVQDETVVFVDEETLKQDHIEIWLDTRPSLYTEEPADKYAMSPYRHKRSGLYQWGLHHDRVLEYLPKIEPETRIQCQTVKTDTGYNMEIAIPLDQFLATDLSNYDKLGFSIVVSDTDNTEQRRQETLIGSSSQKWGDPYSLGELILNPDVLLEDLDWLKLDAIQDLLWLPTN